MQTYEAVLCGAIVVSAWAIALFFFRFWRKLRDPLFGLFSAAFALLGIERIVILASWSEVLVYVYLIRLTAFALILFAIYAKNRPRPGSSPPP